MDTNTRLTPVQTTPAGEEADLQGVVGDCSGRNLRDHRIQQATGSGDTARPAADKPPVSAPAETKAGLVRTDSPRIPAS